MCEQVSAVGGVAVVPHGVYDVWLHIGVFLLIPDLVYIVRLDDIHTYRYTLYAFK